MLGGAGMLGGTPTGGRASSGMGTSDGAGFVTGGGCTSPDDGAPVGVEAPDGRGSLGAVCGIGGPLGVLDGAGAGVCGILVGGVGGELGVPVGVDDGPLMMYLR